MVWRCRPWYISCTRTRGSSSVVWQIIRIGWDRMAHCCGSLVQWMAHGQMLIYWWPTNRMCWCILVVPMRFWSLRQPSSMNWCGRSVWALLAWPSSILVTAWDTFQLIFMPRHHSYNSFGLEMSHFPFVMSCLLVPGIATRSYLVHA